MASITVGILRESAGDEGRIALVPADVGRLQASGVDVLVESGAGQRAGFSDEAYAAAGAAVVDRADLFARATVLVSVGLPATHIIDAVRPGSVLFGLLGLL
jgi:alanine dehydrogenase